MRQDERGVRRDGGVVRQDERCVRRDGGVVRQNERDGRRDSGVERQDGRGVRLDEHCVRRDGRVVRLDGDLFGGIGVLGFLAREMVFLGLGGAGTGGGMKKKVREQSGKHLLKLLAGTE